MSERELRREWTSIQEELRQRLIVTDAVDWSLDPTHPNALRFVGGVDISFEESSNTAIACLVVLQYPDLNVVYEDLEEVELTIPYMAGFLAFREALPFTTLINRVAKTPCNPQVILVDGNGILHPQRFGSASHLGVISDYPTIGVAKSLHCVDGLNEGTVKQNVRNRIQQLEMETPTVETDLSGDTLELKGRSGDVLGVAFFNYSPQRIRNAIYISIGHRVSLETSVALIKRCALCRIPEPVRQADLRSRDYIRKHQPVQEGMRLPK